MASLTWWLRVTRPIQTFCHLSVRPRLRVVVRSSSPGCVSFTKPSITNWAAALSDQPRQSIAICERQQQQQDERWWENHHRVRSLWKCFSSFFLHLFSLSCILFLLVMHADQACWKRKKKKKRESSCFTLRNRRFINSSPDGRCMLLVLAVELALRLGTE